MSKKKEWRIGETETNFQSLPCVEASSSNARHHPIRRPPRNNPEEGERTPSPAAHPSSQLCLSRGNRQNRRQASYRKPKDTSSPSSVVILSEPREERTRLDSRSLDRFEGFLSRLVPRLTPVLGDAGWLEPVKPVEDVGIERRRRCEGTRLRRCERIRETERKRE